MAKASKWAGDFDRRFAAIGACLGELCDAYGLERYQLTHVGSRTGCSGDSRLRRELRRVELTGRLSVVTMLHLFAKARWGHRGLTAHVQAMRWSLNIFKRCFPKSYSRCRLVGGLLVNDARRDD